MRVGTVEPGGDEDADGGDAVGMHVEESEDLRLGIAKGVKDHAGFEGGVLGQVHHHLHADCPLALVVSFGQAEDFVELATDRAHRPIADHGQGGADVHAGQESVFGVAVLIDALVGQADSGHTAAFDERFLYGHSRPHLHGAGGHQLHADVLQELAERHHEAAFLVQEGRNVGQLDGMVFGHAEGANQAVAEVHGGGAAAGIGGVEQVRHLLLFDGDRHGDPAGIEIGHAGADTAGARDHAGDAEADIVGTLVAHHLQGEARIAGALDEGRAVGVHQLAGERGEETGRGGAEADADDVDVHGLAVKAGWFISGPLMRGSPGLRGS